MTAAALVRPVGQLYRARELILLLVARDLKARYRRSVLGMAWTLLNPLLQMGIYTVVFHTVIRVEVPAYALYVLSGLLPWSLVAVSTVASTQALLANQGLIRKVAVPQAVYPLALVGGKAVDLVLSLAPLAAVALLLGRPPTLAWLFLPVALGLLLAFAAGLALALASAAVFFRDLRHLAEVGVQAWFYLTPIVYPAAAVERLGPGPLRALLSANPMTPLVRCFQAPIHEGRLPAAAEVAAAAAVATLSLAAGFLVFHRTEDRHVHWL